MPARTRLRGFTLLEIMLVTLLLGILISVATVRFSHSFDNLRFRNYVLETADLLYYAQDLAILEKSVYRLHMLPEGCRLEHKVDEIFEPVGTRVAALRALPRNVTVQAEPEEIAFYPDGTATQALWAFTDRRDRVIQVAVDPGSGAIRLEDFYGY